MSTRILDQLESCVKRINELTEDIKKLSESSNYVDQALRPVLEDLSACDLPNLQQGVETTVTILNMVLKLTEEERKRREYSTRDDRERVKVERKMAKLERRLTTRFSPYG